MSLAYEGYNTLWRQLFSPTQRKLITRPILVTIWSNQTNPKAHHSNNRGNPAQHYIRPDHTSTVLSRTSTRARSAAGTRLARRARGGSWACRRAGRRAPSGGSSGAYRGACVGACMGACMGARSGARGGARGRAGRLARALSGGDYSALDIIRLVTACCLSGRSDVCSESISRWPVREFSLLV